MACTQFSKLLSGSWCVDEGECCIKEARPDDEIPVIVVKREEDNVPLPESSCVDLRGLQSSNWQTRRDAVTRLGLSGRDADGKVEPEVLTALGAAFKDEHWQVRRQSAFALQELGEVAVQEAMTHLRQACTDQDPYVRTAALLVLLMYDEDAPSRGTQQARIMTLQQCEEHEDRLELFREDDGNHASLELKACKLQDLALLARLQGDALSRATDIFVEQEETTWLEHESYTCLSPRGKTGITEETTWAESESHTGLSPRGKTGTQSTEEGLESLAETEDRWSSPDTQAEENSPISREKSQVGHSCAEQPKKLSNTGTIVRAQGDDSDPIFEGPEECAEDFGTPRGGLKMSLIKEPGTKLGITLELGPQQTLKVLSVEEGSISKWNETQSPESQLQRGDRITAVNGKRGASRRLLEAMQSSGEVLEVMFRRKTHVANEEMDIPEYDDFLGQRVDLKVSSVTKRRQDFSEPEKQQVDLMQTVVWPRGQRNRSTMQPCRPRCEKQHVACACVATL